MTYQQWPAPKPSQAPIWIAAGIAVVVLAAAIVAAALILRSGRDDQTPIAAPSSSAPPEDGGVFNTPEAIIQKAGSALPCGDAEESEEVIGALRQFQCADGSVIIRIYNGRQGVNEALDFKRLTGGDLLTGQNWTVNADEVTVLQTAQQILGGQLVHIPCEKPACVLAD